jgi:murein L,D-transpeptidase YafK
MTAYAADEVNRLAVWRTWVKETVSASKKSGDYAVIVDKAAHTTYLLKAGRIVRKYDCDLGFNPSRQKLFSGDAATPEGVYKVVKAKNTGSRYYKALLLDYPNARDEVRFRENRKRRTIPHDARIGGLIEIHGEGGRDVDWTEGCVALSNADMDHLMRFARVGTPVTIVRTSDVWP